MGILPREIHGPRETKKGTFPQITNALHTKCEGRIHHGTTFVIRTNAYIFLSYNADHTWKPTNPQLLDLQPPGSKATFHLHVLKMPPSPRTSLSDSVTDVLLFLITFSFVLS